MKMGASLFVVLLLSSSVHCFGGIGSIYGYDVTYQLKAATDDWAIYADDSSRVRSWVSVYDDAAVFQPLEFCIPFFSIRSTRLFIGTNGFLSVMPVAMCETFCAASSIREGYYKFHTALENGGGDWPILGLYVHDMDPSNTVANGAIFYWFTTRDGTPAVVVEYRNVAQYTQSGHAVSSVLNAQMELLANGTIFFRYNSVISVPTGDYYLPSVGLVLSKTQRVYATTPQVSTKTGNMSIVAMRFDPTIDTTCGPLTTCDACVAQSRCAWCASTATCLQNAVSDEV